MADITEKKDRAKENGHSVEESMGVTAASHFLTRLCLLFASSGTNYSSQLMATTTTGNSRPPIKSMTNPTSSTYTKQLATAGKSSISSAATNLLMQNTAIAQLVRFFMVLLPLIQLSTIQTPKKQSEKRN
jgi:hypothetical protein